MPRLIHKECLLEMLQSDPSALAALERIYHEGFLQGMERAAEIAESGATESIGEDDKWTLGVYRGHQWAARDIRRGKGWLEFYSSEAQPDDSR